MTLSNMLHLGSVPSWSRLSAKTDGVVAHATFLKPCARQRERVAERTYTYGVRARGVQTLMHILLHTPRVQGRRDVQALMHILLHTRRAHERFGARVNLRTCVRKQWHRRHRAAFHRARPVSAADVRTKDLESSRCRCKKKQIVNTLPLAGGPTD